MTKSPLVTAPVGVTSEEALRLLRENKVEKLPIVEDGGPLVGLITVKDFAKNEQFPGAARDASLYVYTPEPGSDSVERLALLASWGAGTSEAANVTTTSDFP